MRIERIQAVPVRVPRAKPMRSAATERPLVASEFGIVRVAVAGGIEGIGEISMNLEPSGAAQCADVTRVLAPALVGKDARDIQGALVAMDSVLQGGEPAKAGVEIALFDALGKALGVPVYQLLGGRARESVAVRWGLGFGEPAAGVEEASSWVERGFRTLKVKIGRPGTGLDASMVAAVREAFGDSIQIVVDANAGYDSPGLAVKELARLEEFDLQLIEQPLAASGSRGWPRCADV